MSYTEIKMQAILMHYLMNVKHHQYVIPNSMTLFPWEADLASATRSGYAHEIEIKISRADFLRDAKDKPWKHDLLQFPAAHQTRTKPAYFWYATPEGIEIEVPEYAGWLEVYKRKYSYDVRTRKEAPRLHKDKLSFENVATIARLLSYRLMSEAMAKMLHENERL